MKKGLLTLLAALVLAVPARAEIKEFTKFILDVPEGWETSEQGDVVVLVAPDKSASLSIATGPTQGASVKELAEAMSKQLNGEAPTPVDNGYQIFFKNALGTEGQCLVYVEGKTFAMFTMTGPSEEYQGILKSLREK